MLNEDELINLLSTRYIGRSLALHTQVSSTNDLALQRAQESVVLGHVEIADAQTSGRGMRGRQWHSPPGEDLYLSVVEALPHDMATLPILNLAVGMGVLETVDECVQKQAHPCQAALKWPNDTYLNERKCAGILIETLTPPAKHAAAVIGIGLNINRQHWPVELQGSATSLRAGTQATAPLDRHWVCARMLHHLERWLVIFYAGKHASIVRSAEARLLWRGQRVLCEGIEGTLIGLDPQGALCLHTTKGERVMYSGQLRQA